MRAILFLAVAGLSFLPAVQPAGAEDNPERVAYTHFTYVRDAAVDRTGALHFVQTCGGNDCEGVAEGVALGLLGDRTQAKVYRLDAQGATVVYRAKHSAWELGFGCDNTPYMAEHSEPNHLWRVGVQPQVVWRGSLHGFDFDCAGVFGEPGALYFALGAIYKLSQPGFERSLWASLPFSASDITFHAGKAYVVDWRSLTVHELRPDGTTIPVYTRPVCCDLSSVTFAPDGRMFYTNPNYYTLLTVGDMPPIFRKLSEFHGTLLAGAPVTVQALCAPDAPGASGAFRVDDATPAVLHFQARPTTLGTAVENQARAGLWRLDGDGCWRLLASFPPGDHALGRLGRGDYHVVVTASAGAFVDYVVQVAAPA